MQISDVVDLFLARAQAQRAQPAIRVRDRRITYGELEHRVRQFAGAMARCPGPRGLIALPQGPDAYAAMVGAGLAGCFYAPLNVETPLEKQLHIVRLLQPDFIVAEPALAVSLLNAAPEAVVIAPDALGEPELEGRGSRHEIAYIIFTSGTTGAPKGVVIPRVALNHFVDWVGTSQTIKPDDRVAQFSNIAFDVSVTDIFGTLALGATLFPVIGRADRMFPARLVKREQITVWNSTPSVLSLMMQAGEATQKFLGSLRLVNTCGEPLLRAHLQALFEAVPDLVFQNSYGPTETTVTMTELRLSADDFEPACGSYVAIGDPIARIGVHLIGGSHPNEGEIVITGPQLALGYWNDPEKTAASFKTIEVDGVPIRAYFSGDWAERRGPYMFFKERVDLQVKIRGFRLELDEVARAINDLGYPVTCVLKWREEVAAVIEQRPDQAFDEATLRRALAMRLEPHAIPTLMRVVDHIPRTQNDKLDRRAVAQWLESEPSGVLHR